ncbi:MAG: YfhO family protein [Lachnospiraceae bacterium]|nr:YfhO family protein [Lachnospiraceae bacterium]
MKKRLKQHVMSFALPVFLLLVIYMIWGQYPFGNETLLIWDMDEQYAPFFAHLHNILHGDASALYTFSRAIGGNMLSVSAYYLISPFNLIFYFFDAENIYIGILIVALLKTGTCGLAMHWFLNQRRQDSFSIIFSTAYALSAYMIGYQFNIFWIDALILLPLLCSAIERLVDEQKYLFYSITIALSVITNFYTGYMICIFSVLYFVCYFIFISDKKSNKKDSFKTVLVYIASSFLGGMLSMCISLPTLDIMRDGKTGLSLSILKNFKNMFKYSELFDAAFCGTISNKQITSGKPLIYCGVFALIMALYWLICAKTPVRKKIGYILQLFVIVVSFHHYNLNCVWHVFNRPTGSPYRYSFIYIFIVLYIAYMGYIELRDNGMVNKYDKYVIFGIGFVLGLGLLCRIGNFMENQKVNIMLLNIFLTAAYIGLVYIVKNKVAGRFMILLFTCAELVINAECLYMVSSQYDSVKVDEYQEYMQKMAPLVEESKRAVSEDDGIVRTAIERSATRTSNDPFMFGLYGLTSYTSVEKQNVINIAGNFGYSNNIGWGMHYNDGATMTGDAFLGVKYLISGKNPGSGYNMLKESGDIALYESENTLPFALFMDSSIMEDKSLENPFQYMNELYDGLDTSQDEEIFRKIEGNLIRSINCSIMEDGGWMADEELKHSESDESGNESAYLEYEFETDLEMTVYTRYDRAGVSNAEVYIEDEKIDLSSERSDVKKIGILPTGCKFVLRCYLPEDGVLSSDKIYVYGERADMLEAYVIDVNNQPINIRMHNEAYIEISCTNGDAETKYLLCTIPYDKGWSAKINGKRVETEDIQNFVALPIENGEYEIELRFVPRGLYAGIIMTCVSILILVIMSMPHRMKQISV